MNSFEKIDSFIKSYANFLNKSTSISNISVNEEMYSEPEEYFKRITDSWFESVDESIGCSPKEFFENADLPSSADEVHVIIKNIALNLSVNTPEFLLSYLKKSEYTKEAIKDILSKDTAESNMYSNTSEDVEIYLQATVIASIFTDLIPDLLDVYRRGDSSNELMFENVSDSLSLLKAFKESAEYMNSEPVTEFKHLSLISMLGLDADKSDEVYYCLKDCFKKAKDNIVKLTVAFAISDYGDSRAVPILRKYALYLVKELQNKEDEELRSNLGIMLSIITSLGGNIEDIQKN